MQAITFYATLPFLYLISILPFSVLHLLSDCVFVITYYIIGYRKNIVTENLKKSFPEKSEPEIAELRKKYYRFLCDMSLEIHKTLTISKEEMRKRCKISADALMLMDRLYDQKKSFIIVMGHQGNWEWAGNAFSLLCKHPLYVIFHPLSNKYFNAFINRIRMRFGTKLIEMKNTFRDMIKMKGEITATAFIADQSPGPENAQWLSFLNQDTPVFRGTEVIAKKLNYPVLFITVKKIKRGYYEACGEMLCENPSTAPEGEISAMHTKKLEQEIRIQPETWLWSHRRWKHKREKEGQINVFQ